MAERGTRMPNTPQQTAFRCDFCFKQYHSHKVTLRTFYCNIHHICRLCYALGLPVLEITQPCPICDGSAIRTGHHHEQLRKTIVIVMERWDDIMDPASTMGRDLANHFGGLDAANVFCVVTRCARIDMFEARDRGITLLECSNTYEYDLDVVRDEIGEIDTLVGFGPVAIELTNAINEALVVRHVMLIYTDIFVKSNFSFPNARIWSIGPKLFTINQYIGDLEHRQIIPPINNNFNLDIAHTQNKRYRIIFPLILKSTERDYLGEHGVYTGLSAIKQFADIENVFPEVTFLLNSSIREARAIITVAEKFGIRDPLFRYPRSTREWLHEIHHANLALCTSRNNEYQHWIHTIIDSNIPFLVSKESGVGEVLCETHPFAVVQTGTSYTTKPNDTGQWCRAIQRALKNEDSTRIDHCHGNGCFLRLYRDGFLPIANSSLDMYDLVLYPIGHINHQDIVHTNNIIRDRFQRLSDVITRMDMLEISKCSVQLKWSSEDVFTRSDLELEKNMITLYRQFQTLGLTIIRVDPGSLVFKILARNKGSAERFIESVEEGSLLQLVKKYSLRNDVSDDVVFGFKLFGPGFTEDSRLLTSGNVASDSTAFDLQSNVIYRFEGSRIIVDIETHLPSLDRMVPHTPEYLDATLQLGVKQFQGKDYTKAASNFHQIIDVGREDIENNREICGVAYCMLSDIKLLRKDFHGAVVDLISALDISKYEQHNFANRLQELFILSMYPLMDSNFEHYKLSIEGYANQFFETGTSLYRSENKAQQYSVFVVLGISCVIYMRFINRGSFRKRELCPKIAECASIRARVILEVTKTDKADDTRFHNCLAECKLAFQNGYDNHFETLKTYALASEKLGRITDTLAKCKRALAIQGKDRRLLALQERLEPTTNEAIDYGFWEGTNALHREMKRQNQVRLQNEKKKNKKKKNKMKYVSRREELDSEQSPQISKSQQQRSKSQQQIQSTFTRKEPQSSRSVQLRHKSLPSLLTKKQTKNNADAKNTTDVTEIRTPKGHSLKMFNFLEQQQCTIYVGCKEHISDHLADGVITNHERKRCCKNMLFVTRDGKTIALRRRPMVLKSKAKRTYNTICDNILKLDTCSDSCENPHSNLEQKLWNDQANGKFNYGDFLTDIQKSELHKSKQIERLRLDSVRSRTISSSTNMTMTSLISNESDDLEFRLEDFDLADILPSSSKIADNTDVSDGFVGKRIRKWEPYYTNMPLATIKKYLKENPDKYQECTIHLNGTSEARCITLAKESITIKGRHNCGPAFDGDTVAVEIMETKVLDDETTVMRGKVLGVLQRNTDRRNQTFVCRVDFHQSTLMVPVCGTAPKVHIYNNELFRFPEQKRNSLVPIHENIDDDLILRKWVTLTAENRNNLLFLVRYLKWDPYYMYPLGYVSQVLPCQFCDEAELLTQDIIHQVPRLYPENIIDIESITAKSSAVKSKDNISTRQDFRDRYTVTIDPDGCQDIDDALSIKKLKSEGNDLWYEIGVHIADVSAYVAKGDPVDKEATWRMTSYYPLNTKAYHMLPDILSEDLCSLQADEDRLTLSVILIMNIKGEIKSKEIYEGIIRNNQKMSYTESQEILDSDEDSSELETAIKTLYKISKGHRKKRLGLRMYYVNDHKDNCFEAHQLVEEFMILTNETVTDYLVNSSAKYYIPLRKQDAPQDNNIQEWLGKHHLTGNESLYFDTFNQIFNNFQTDGQQETQQTTFMYLLSETWVRLEEAIAKGDIKTVKQYIGSESIHPLQAVALQAWYEIQFTAEYVCFGDEITDAAHFSLQKDQYCQFTSPIRRYLDIVVHRLVKAVLHDTEPEYTIHEITRLCEKATAVTKCCKKYSKAMDVLNISRQLRDTPKFYPSIVQNLEDMSFNIHIPDLPKLKKRDCSVKYNDLDVIQKPEMSSDYSHTTVTMSKRMYDDSGKPLEYGRTLNQTRFVFPLSHETYRKKLTLEEWKSVKNHLQTEDINKVIEILSTQIGDTSHCHDREITSEMKTGDPIIDQHCKFSKKLTVCSVLYMQMGADYKHGILQPCMRLLKLTPKLDLCLEHAHEPVKCFSEVATRNVTQTYNDIETYQETWLPLLSMEAATNAVGDGDPIVIHNVLIKWTKTDNDIEGSFELKERFVKDRKIGLIRNSKNNEEESFDFFCIRCPIGHKNPFSGMRDVWVGHAVGTKATSYKDEDGVSWVKLIFRLHHSNQCSLTGDKPTLISVTIEMLPKSLPYSRMEEAVRCLEKANELCQHIVTGEKQYPDIETIIKTLVPPSLHIQATVYLPRNNETQEQAIKHCLENPFTVIQGPPGTGKTLTGTKIVYWFNYINHKLAEALGDHSTGKRQILYCGPSNSAVDVAMNLMRQRLGNKCPKIIRVYSEILESQVYPVPREVNNVKSRGRKFELIDKNGHKDVALHHLIRKPENKFSKQILTFDKLFAKNLKTPQNVKNEKIEEYYKLIADASIHELKKYDVVMATCSASASPRMKRGCNITQCIIDECGMCMEAESLIPFVTFSPSQVVLIGDHKQLRPIIVNQDAKNLGLDKSLFERYSDVAITLDTQYRMHPEICRMPSELFYDGILKSVHKSSAWDRDRVTIWPNTNIPIAFCHVEGSEISLTVFTNEGNEQSKYNEAERDHVGRIYIPLINRYQLTERDIIVMSQYKAQCCKIEEHLKDIGFSKPNVSTVVASQGDEYDYVILSLVRSLPRYEIDKRPSLGWCHRNMGFITDQNQINVALTRARKGIIILGNKHLLKCDEMWKKLIEHYESKNIVVDAENFPPVETMMTKQMRKAHGKSEYSFEARVEKQMKGERAKELPVAKVINPMRVNRPLRRMLSGDMSMRRGQGGSDYGDEDLGAGNRDGWRTVNKKKHRAK